MDPREQNCLLNFERSANIKYEHLQFSCNFNYNKKKKSAEKNLVLTKTKFAPMLSVFGSDSILNDLN